jgi:hypothetical protein
MITYVTEILEWQTFNKETICPPFVPQLMRRQDEHAKWIKMIFERAQLYTVEILRGSTFTDLTLRITEK